MMSVPEGLHIGRKQNVSMKSRAVGTLYGWLPQQSSGISRTCLPARQVCEHYLLRLAFYGWFGRI